jgi:diacylglycerol kinase family enzyme
MYYYVFEQPENKKQEKTQEKIRINLEELRIIGEVTKSNPVQRPEELVASGITKGYNTIVIVGSDSLINRMTTYIAGKDITLGIIPLSPESPFLHLTGAKNITQACEILPFRRIIQVDIGKVEDNRYFLSKIDLVPAVEKGTREKAHYIDSASTIIDFGEYQVHTRTSRVTIENGQLELSDDVKIKQSFTDGLLDIYSAPAGKAKEGFLSKIFKRGPEPEPYSSIFHSNHFRVSASPLMAVVSGDKIIAKTPLEISLIPKALKIIVSRTKE